MVTPCTVMGPAGTCSAEVMRVSGNARLLASVAHDCRVAGGGGAGQGGIGRAAMVLSAHEQGSGCAAEIARGVGTHPGFFIFNERMMLSPDF